MRAPFVAIRTRSHAALGDDGPACSEEQSCKKNKKHTLYLILELSELRILYLLPMCARVRVRSFVRQHGTASTVARIGCLAETYFRAGQPCRGYYFFGPFGKQTASVGLGERRWEFVLIPGRERPDKPPYRSNSDLGWEAPWRFSSSFFLAVLFRARRLRLRVLFGSLISFFLFVLGCDKQRVVVVVQVRCSLFLFRLSSFGVAMRRSFRLGESAVKEAHAGSGILDLFCALSAGVFIALFTSCTGLDLFSTFLGSQEDINETVVSWCVPLKGSEHTIIMPRVVLGLVCLVHFGFAREHLRLQLSFRDTSTKHNYSCFHFFCFVAGGRRPWS